MWSLLISLLTLTTLLLLTTPTLAYPDFLFGLKTLESQYPGYYDPSLNGTYVPLNRERIIQKWFVNKERVRVELGDIYCAVNITDTYMWNNSVSTVNELLELAYANVEGYKAYVNELVMGLPPYNVYPSYGPGDKYMIKSNASIASKLDRLERDGLKQAYLDALRKIGDVLRGTIVIKTVEEFLTVLNRLDSISQKHNIQYYVDNKFAKSTSSSGYIGIHLTLLMHLGAKTLKAELQLHFYDIMDGSEDCPKEFTHSIYEITREKPTPKNKAEGDIAQMFVFYYGLSRLNSHSLFDGMLTKDFQPKQTYYLLDGLRLYRTTPEGFEYYNPLKDSFVTSQMDSKLEESALIVDDPHIEQIKSLLKSDLMHSHYYNEALEVTGDVMINVKQESSFETKYIFFIGIPAVAIMVLLLAIFFVRKSFKKVGIPYDQVL